MIDTKSIIYAVLQPIMCSRLRCSQLTSSSPRPHPSFGPHIAWSISTLPVYNPHPLQTIPSQRQCGLLKLAFAMLSIRSFLGWKEEPSPSPTSVIITGVRIPADGTPARLLTLPTITPSNGRDAFLFHIPDLRHYWNNDWAWESRDPHRLDLQLDHHVPPQQHLRQTTISSDCFTSVPLDCIIPKDNFISGNDIFFPSARLFCNSSIHLAWERITSSGPWPSMFCRKSFCSRLDQRC